MNDKVMNQYLSRLLPIEDPFIEQVKKEAIRMNVPIMEDTSLHLLTILLQLMQPKRILEIGTGIGYSALKMAQATPKSEILTLERDHKRYEKALKIIQQRDSHNRIQVIHDDAINFLQTEQEKKFDFIYIDAAKSKYQQFFELADENLQEKGMIITDNVLFRGYVVNSKNIPKRFVKIVKRLQHFNKWLSNHPDYVTSIVPVGDGIAISVRKANY